MARIYFSAALFTLAEQAFNARLGGQLAASGHEVFLPQDHAQGGVKAIYHINKDALDASDLVLAVVDGADVDSGVAWEIGYAAAKGIPVIGLRTDFRNRSETPDAHGSVNPMLLFSLTKYVDAGKDYLDHIVDAITEVPGRLN